MPINQKFQLNTGTAYAGMPYGLTRSHAAIFTQRADARINYGVVVKQGTGGTGVATGTDATADQPVYGVAMRTINRAPTSFPSDGTVFYEKGEEMAVMREGEIMLIAGSGVTREQSLYVSATTGLVYGTAGTGRVQVSNLKAIKAAATGDVFPARIFQAP